MTMLSAPDIQVPEARESTLTNAVVKRVRGHARDMVSSVAKLSKDDPRRVVHSLKVGVALTLVSLFYYFQPLYNSFGVSAIWAVITVVVVFEFYVGATLGKGLNRALGTLIGGVLAVGAHLLAGLCGNKAQPIIIAHFVFLQAITCTFVRFFPKIKARYDYGLLVFMLTFCIISITGVRQDQIIELAHKRLATIAIGAFSSLLVSTLVCPIWAGQDLHNLLARNIEHLANYLEGFETTFLTTSETESKVTSDHNKCYSVLMQGYKSILTSKGTEDSLANFALWEPPHGKFNLYHPWKHYLKLGSLARKCSYRIDTLNSYAQGTVKMEGEEEEVEKACKKMSSECSKALKQIASSVRAMARPRAYSVGTHIQSSKEAMEKLRLWQLQSVTNMFEKKLIVVGAILGGIVECTEEIAEVANELASLARFQDVGLTACENEKMECDHAVVAIVDPGCNAAQEDLTAFELDLDFEINGQNIDI